MDVLTRSVEIAAKAHAGQVDKAGRPYILHPLRLMMRMDTPQEMMTAVLHDAVEDSDWTIADLRSEGLPYEVLQALELLSRRDGQTYEQFIAQIKPNALARKVKLADLADNMDLPRLENVGPKELERLAKYHWAFKELTTVPLS